MATQSYDPSRRRGVNLNGHVGQVVDPVEQLLVVLGGTGFGDDHRHDDSEVACPDAPYMEVSNPRLRIGFDRLSNSMSGSVVNPLIT